MRCCAALAPAGGVRQYLHNMYKDGKDPEISINEGGVEDYIGKVRGWPE
jgi:hypothetical protein